MEKICWANTDDFEQSEFVIIGIPDESQSHAIRKGTEEAPSKIRQISNLRDSFERDGKLSLGRPFQGSEKKVHDFGDINRSQIEDVYDKISKSSKIPISIGGDHSITRQIINQMTKKYGKISLVYFDAHPDFVSSTTNYYGSVVNDILSNIEVTSSVQIGIRTPEQEELDNIKKFNLKVITPFDIREQGIKQVANSIMEKLGDKAYISFDMDCIDPAYAPGVSVPVPMGLSSTDAVYLLKEIAKKGIIGMDIMEVCPSFDVKDRTSHLASRIISEVLYSSGGI
ncbi:Agmatinase protein [Marine Group I thaumarchaeote SCGC AAA799-E16]|uniref:Agmatinase protein n=4 Tax=Marine Group I TaxID=905826 RepID=A0A081RNS5_9ARCH|nr:Agmatinase protein [Marine Group I thaumarchaeote SCGC AAA799-N04]KER05877.1 Agmatinase protein [Marine Group I thaumarchaeote SCGC AAA799-E16]KFM16262.1 Agmatinase protein [Marine Group I thaumarchaeote SCGC AAA799-D11]KFM16471.1 Agmatinase protein [Marine Group I thaumarchaeote SCGC RSA3]